MSKSEEGTCVRCLAWKTATMRPFPALLFISCCWAFLAWLALSSPTLHPLWLTVDLIALAGATLLLLPLLYGTVIGQRIYLWLDRDNQLHIHRANWWIGMSHQELVDCGPKSAVFELMVGGWFRCSKVNGASTLWNVRLNYKLFQWLPSTITVTHNSTDKVTLKCTTSDQIINSTNVASLLWMVTESDPASALLRLRQYHKHSAPVAGKIPVGA